MYAGAFCVQVGSFEPENHLTTVETGVYKEIPAVCKGIKDFVVIYEKFFLK